VGYGQTGAAIAVALNPPWIGANDLPADKSVELPRMPPRRGAKSRAPEIWFPEPIQRDLGRPVFSQKIFRHAAPKVESSSDSEFQKFAWQPARIRDIDASVPPLRGAARERHGRGVGCGGRWWRIRRMRLKRTAKSCGP